MPQLELRGPCFAPLKSMLKQQLSSMTMCTKTGRQSLVPTEERGEEMGSCSSWVTVPLWAPAWQLASSAWCYNGKSISKEMVLKTACLRKSSKCFEKITAEPIFPALHCLAYLDFILSLHLWFFFSFISSYARSFRSLLLSIGEADKASSPLILFYSDKALSVTVRRKVLTRWNPSKYVEQNANAILKR